MSRRVLCVVGAVLAVTMAACGSALPGSTAGTGTPSAAPSGAPTLAPGTSAFPDHDTAIDTAPAALAALWRPYGVSLIPGAEVTASLESTAATIPTTNGSAGAFSDAQVHDVVLAYLRDQLLAGWADEHVQPALAAHLAGQLFLVGADSLAMSEGTAVHLPPCALIPTAITVLAPSPELDAQLRGRNQDITAGAFPMRLGYTGCAVTGTTRSGQTVTVDPAAAPVTIVADGVIRHDPVLGDIMYAEGATVCPDTAVPAVCAG